MKILAFTDPHGGVSAARSVACKALAERPDVVVCAGDLTFFGQCDPLFFDELASMGSEVYCIPGNHDTAEMMRELGEKYPFLVDVSFQAREVEGVIIAGVPGNDLAFWPGASKQDGDVLKLAIDLWGSLNSAKPQVFLAHYPPSGTAIAGTSQPTPDSGGSRVVRRIVETLKPALVVSGHYHQDFEKTTEIGDIQCVNPGPNGMTITIGD